MQYDLTTREQRLGRTARSRIWAGIRDIRSVYLRFGRFALVRLS